MSQRAILFAPQNFALIVQETNDTTTPMLEETYKIIRFRGENFYFIPDYITKFGKPFNSWALPAQEYMDEEFTYDIDKIKTEFVEITRN